MHSSLATAHRSPYNSRLLQIGAYSSVGQSSRLIIDWSQVQVLLGPPFPSVMSDLIGLFQRRKAALRETRLAFCWTHHLRWSTDLISKLSARPRPPLR